MRNTALWIASALTVLLGLYGLFTWDAWMNATAAACGDRACVWIYDPHVAPGGTVTLTVGVYDGLEAGVERVRVLGPGVEVAAAGEGATWGGSISTGSFQRGHDALDVVVHVPPDAEAGAPLPLDVELTWIAATYAGFTIDQFDNELRFDRIAVPIAVRTPAGAAVRRLGSALVALVALVLGTGVAWFALRELKGVDDTGDANLPEAAGAAAVLLAMGWGIVGWVALSRPLQAALDLPSTALSVLAVIGWLGITGAGAWRLDRLRGAPYRLRLTQPMSAEQVERWLRRLRDEGVEVRRLPGAVVFTRTSPAGRAERVWAVRPGRSSGRVPFRGDGDDLVLLAAVCAARGVGALDVELHGISLPVAPDTTAAGLREALDRESREQLLAIQQLLDRTGAMLDRLRPFVR